jgi:hypothetical protein
MVLGSGRAGRLIRGYRRSRPATCPQPFCKDLARPVIPCSRYPPQSFNVDVRSFLTTPMAGHNVAPAIFFMTQHQGSRGLYVTTSTGVPMGSRTFEIFALKSIRRQYSRNAHRYCLPRWSGQYLLVLSRNHLVITRTETFKQ